MEVLLSSEKKKGIPYKKGKFYRSCTMQVIASSRLDILEVITPKSLRVKVLFLASPDSRACGNKVSGFLYPVGIAFGFMAWLKQSS